MKKIFTNIAILAALVGAGSASAYSAERPNRVIIVDKAGGYNSYVTEDIAQLQFRYVPGDVSVAVQILEEVQVDYMVLEMLKSEACQSFSLSIVPRNLADQLNTMAAKINYVESDNPTRYYTDFTYGEVSGINLEYSTPYSILTVAYDELGIAAGVTVTNFETPSVEILGDPYVKVTPEIVELTAFQLHFEPNEYVGKYYLCSFQGGTVEEQFQMFGTMMGAANLNEFIVTLAWNKAQEGAVSYAWTDMDPGSTYDIAIAITDKNGNFTPQPQIYSVTTEGMGGTGEAYVDVIPGEYVLADWDGQMLPSQFFTFSPNEETLRYRWGIWFESDYDQDPQGHNMSVQQDAPPAYGDWWTYGEISGDYQMDPNISYVIVVASQNLNHEWGKLNVFRYTTPAQVSTRGDVKARPAKAPAVNALDAAPNVRNFVTAPRKLKKLTLTNKQS